MSDYRPSQPRAVKRARIILLAADGVRGIDRQGGGDQRGVCGPMAPTFQRGSARGWKTGLVRAAPGRFPAERATAATGIVSGLLRRLVVLKRGDKIRQLAGIPLFADFNKRQLGEVAKHVDEVDVAESTRLTDEGTIGRQFGIIVSGSAVVRRNNRKLADLGNGDFFGEMALLLRVPSSATVTTTADSTLLVMHSRDFAVLLDRVPALAKKLAIGLAARLLEADNKLVH